VEGDFVEGDRLAVKDAELRTNEVALVSASRAGDTEAFGRLVRMYQRRAVAVAYRFLSHSADAEDVAQEAFVQAYRKLDQLDDDARFGSWLMRIVVNRSRNLRRGSKATRLVSLEDGMEPSLSGPRLSGQGQIGSTDEALIASESASRLKKAIDEAMEILSEKQREALILFSVEGMPQKEVAEILDCSVELVKWNVFQARKRLKELLSEYL